MQGPGGHDLDTSAKIREKIDAELAVLHARVRVLHAKRNTLSLLYSLPSDILICVFIEYQKTITISSSLADHKKYRAWIKILQITQHLREIGLQSPELWSDIVVTDRHWVSKFVKRSGSHDLNVKLWVDKPHFVKPLKQVIGELERISALNVFLDGKYWKDILPALKGPAPRLKLLRLHVHIKSGNEHPSIPVDLFSETHPKLKDLSVMSCNLDLMAPLFTMTDLTNLCITSPKNLFPISEVLRVLQNQPALRSLTLRHTLAAGEAGGGSPVHLPSLTSLQIEHEVDLETNNSFLASLILPETVDIDLSSSAVPFQPQGFVVSAIDSAKRATQNASLEFRDIQIDWGTNSLLVVCMKQPRSLSGKLSLPFVRMKFTFDRELAPEDQDKWLTGLPNWLLLPLEVLQFQGYGPTSPEIWGYLSRLIPGLQHLLLGIDQDMRPLVEYFRLQYPVESSALPIVADDEKLEADKEVGMVYPALRRLTLFNPSYECLVALCHPLAIRRKRGVGLDELSLVEWTPRRTEGRDKIDLMFRDKVNVIRWMEMDDLPMVV
ncbi:hypothetical protein BDN72DRAFT_845232 [Pluteus cervinus]|uniref:Uncharacterized protein n=1 Tax=Pluteus cervinus TaxID=181527 RepID=A0ACD3AJ13_9AGAR|nr:hypothetical protein BDN72DRAFT_845232 [Pluteus cervinus]